MYKIGEFSKIVGLTIKALRYYEEVGILIPAQVDEVNNYRYYDEDNYVKALWIKTLKKYGFTIKEVKDVLPKIHHEDDLADFLLEKQGHIDLQILALKQMQRNIASEIQTLKEVKIMAQQQVIEQVALKDMLVASVRYKGKYEEVGKYLGRLYKAVGMKGLSTPFSMYYDESYREDKADVAVCVEVKSPINKGEVRTHTIKGGKFVSLIHVGSYDTLSSSYKALADYLKAHDLTSHTPSREIYLKGPGMLFKGNPKKYETKILFPISD